MRWIPEENFVPRALCGDWAAGWAKAAEVFNYGAALCFMIIPIMTLMVIYKLRRVRYLTLAVNLHISSLMLLFMLSATFTMLCSLHHYYEALAFSDPMYHKQTVVDALLFITAFITTVSFPRLALPFVMTIVRVIRHER